MQYVLMGIVLGVDAVAQFAELYERHFNIIVMNGKTSQWAWRIFYCFGKRKDNFCISVKYFSTSSISIISHALRLIWNLSRVSWQNAGLASALKAPDCLSFFYVYVCRGV